MLKKLSTTLLIILALPTASISGCSIAPNADLVWQQLSARPTNTAIPSVPQSKTANTNIRVSLGAQQVSGGTLSGFVSVKFHASAAGGGNLTMSPMSH